MSIKNKKFLKIYQFLFEDYSYNENISEKFIKTLNILKKFRKK